MFLLSVTVPLPKKIVLYKWSLVSKLQQQNIRFSTVAHLRKETAFVRFNV